MTSLLIRIDPVAVPPIHKDIQGVFLLLSQLQEITSELSSVLFVARQSSPLIFDLTIRSDGRTWSQVLTFSGPLDTDPAVSFSASGSWFDRELGLLRSIREALVQLRSSAAITAFSAAWVVSSDPGHSLIEMVASPGSVPAGQPLVLNFIAPTSDQGSATDWIGVYAQGAADSAYLAWIYVGSQTQGSHSFPTNGFSAGSYEFRYFLNNGWTKTQTSVPFTIT